MFALHFSVVAAKLNFSSSCYHLWKATRHLLRLQPFSLYRITRVYPRDLNVCLSSRIKVVQKSFDRKTIGRYFDNLHLSTRTISRGKKFSPVQQSHVRISITTDIEKPRTNHMTFRFTTNIFN